MPYTKKGVTYAVLAAIAQASSNYFLQNHLAAEVGESIVCIPDGIGLAVLLLQGWQYWPFVLLGSFIGEIGDSHSLLADMLLALALLLSYFTCAFLLRYLFKFDIYIRSLKDYMRLLSASFVGALCGAASSVGILLWGNLPLSEPLAESFRERFIGDFFGFAFITPILLLLSKSWIQEWPKERQIKFAICFLVAFLFGQAVFFGWFKEYIDLTGRGFAVIFLVGLFGYIFGRQGAIFYFAAVVVQALLSTMNGTAFFDQQFMTNNAQVPIWAYLGFMCIVGLSVGLVVENYEHQSRELATASKRISESEARFREMVGNTPALMATYSLSTQVTDYVNPYFTSALGYTAEDLCEPNAWWPLAYPDLEYRHAIQEEWVRRGEEAAKLGGRFAPLETKTTCKDGSTKLISWGSFEISDRIVIYGLDVTEQRRVEAVLKVSSAVFRAMGEAVLIKDAQGSILMANDAFIELTGFQAEDLLGKAFQSILVKRHGASSYSDIYTSIEAMGRWEGQAWIRTKAGEEVLRFISIYSTFDDTGLPLQRIVLISEVTDQRKARELINQQANFDPLTGLPNRRLMFDRLDQLIKQSARSGKSIAVAYIDLDNFKDINDSRGHDFGDQLLIAVAAKLRLEVRGTDTVARIGGDEFVILLGDLEKPEVADMVIRGVTKRLAEPIHVQDQAVYITASIGVSMYPNDGSDGKSLLLGADQAMYAAKVQGRNNYQYFTQSLQVKATYRAGVISELRTALEKGQFRLHYQPIFNLATGQISHAEALIRWHRSNGEVAPPSSFIDIAEESGLIVEIGDWVWREALRFFSSLKHPPEFTLSINVSASQFNSSKHSAANWIEILREYQVSPESIVLEITERMMLIQSQRVLRKIAMLQESGCKFSVDDFGTGYSSLASLKTFNFDYIKIDANFIKSLGSGGQDLTLVSAMVSMAKGLGLRSIAEGVETAEQAQILRSIDCDYAQGYLYSKPLPEAEFQELLQGQEISS